MKASKECSELDDCNKKAADEQLQQEWNNKLVNVDVDVDVNMDVDYDVRPRPFPETIAYSERP